MKKTGILNAQLMGLITALGHKDEFLIADAGMPIPKGVEIVDLVLVGGVPSFRQTMDAVLAETCVESYTLAEEIELNGNRFRTKKVYAVCCKIVVPLAMFLVLFGQLQTFGIIK